MHPPADLEIMALAIMSVVKLVPLICRTFLSDRSAVGPMTMNRGAVTLRDRNRVSVVELLVMINAPLSPLLLLSV